jgi:phosphatidylglycerophosphatase C
MTKNNTLALFDFDGTITKKDTFLEFIKFTHGKTRFWFGIGLMSPIIIGHLLNLLGNTKAKTMVLRYFFGGWEYHRFKKAGEDFCENVLPNQIKRSAMEKIKFHLENEHRVILVTASAKEWVQPWTQKMGIELLSSELEVKNGKITGRLACPNCYGPEKVNRINTLLLLHEYSTIYAYGDSNGDKEMLKIAHQAHYKHFRD